jgi:hypothetical protein
VSQEIICAVARDVTERKRREEERESLVRQLQAAVAEVQHLQQLLPICMYCRNIRDHENHWQTIEEYIARHTTTRFSHGICPTCYGDVVEPQLESRADIACDRP